MTGEDCSLRKSVAAFSALHNSIPLPHTHMFLQNLCVCVCVCVCVCAYPAMVSDLEREEGMADGICCAGTNEDK